MARLLALALVAGIGLIAYTITTAEPSDPGAVTLVVFGVGISAFAIGTAVLHYIQGPFRRGRRRARRRVSVRRGFLVGLGVATLAFLRSVDALSAVTALFVVAALAALEGVLSARG